MVVEVFKTNVDEADRAELLVKQLLFYFPESRINFDMQDCDKILRIEAEVVIPQLIIEILNTNGYSCQILY